MTRRAPALGTKADDSEPWRAGNVLPIRGARLTLLNGFRLECDDDTVRLPSSVQRLLALVALAPDPLTRPRIAFTLWNESTESHAYGSLRSALWRLRQLKHRVVVATEDTLALAPGVLVDYHHGLRLANGLLEEHADAAAISLLGGPLAGELLPGWYDDWVLDERERYNELRLHALEALCELNLHEGRVGHAIDACLTAVRIDPLRESSHRALIRAYLTEGNRAEALRHYRRFARRLRDETGLRPSAQMDELVLALTLP
jgi:DNA-binding SARP family transcriptional activator